MMRWANTPNGEINADAKAQAAKAADQLNTLQAQFGHSIVGNDLQILPSFMHAASTIAMALSLPHTGSAPLFIGLSMATQGMLDPHLESSLDSFIHGMAPQLGTAGHEFLKMQTTVALATVIGLASQAVSQGFGPLPNPSAGGRSYALAFRCFIGFSYRFQRRYMARFHQDDRLRRRCRMHGTPCRCRFCLPDPGRCIAGQEVKATNFLAFSAALHMVASSNVLGEFFEEAVAVSGGDSKAQTQIAPLLTQLAHMLIILAATREDGRQSAAPLVEDHADGLQKGVNAAEALSGEAAGSTAVAIEQLQAALSEKDYTGFIDAFTHLLSEQHGSSDWTKEFDLLRQLTAQINEQATSKKCEEPLTGIVHSV